MEYLQVITKIDKDAFLWLNGWVGQYPWVDGLIRLVVSDYLVPLLLALALLGLWFTGETMTARTRNQYGVICAVMALVLANVAVEVLNGIFFRPRPFASFKVSLLFYRPTDSSFPANPAAVAFAVATAVWMWNRKVGAVLIALAVLYSFSRVYAGVFYPLDVLGGGAIGAGAGVMAAWLIRRFRVIPKAILRVARRVYLA
ncbi:MAG: phosphatase PAP2 family protein [Chloroflexi bacterium]|nr:phosphatase PAP2 family protein [Chloroflexota bacterium]